MSGAQELKAVCLICLLLLKPFWLACAGIPWMNQQTDEIQYTIIIASFIKQEIWNLKVLEGKHIFCDRLSFPVGLGSKGGVWTSIQLPGRHD